MRKSLLKKFISGFTLQNFAIEVNVSRKKKREVSCDISLYKHAL